MRCRITFYTLYNTFLVLSEHCNDDENWKDPYYIESGRSTRRCNDLSYDSCRDSVKNMIMGQITMIIILS